MSCSGLEVALEPAIEVEVIEGSFATLIGLTLVVLLVSIIIGACIIYLYIRRVEKKWQDIFPLVMKVINDEDTSMRINVDNAIFQNGLSKNGREQSNCTIGLGSF